MTATALAPLTRTRTIENTVEFGNAKVSFLLSGEDTNGTFSVLEVIQLPGTEPPYHIHTREDETFYLLEGHVSVMVDGVISEASTGDTVFLPRGLPHTFRVRSEFARALILITPSGFEDYFREIGGPVASLDVPRLGECPAVDFLLAGAAATRNGIEFAREQPQF